MFNLLSYDFMQRAFLAVIAMSLFSPVLGTFLILRRQSLDRKSTRLNSSHPSRSRMPSSA